MAKLDVELDSLLVRMALFEANPTEKAFYDDPAMRLDVSVRFSGDVAALSDAGFNAAEVHHNIAYGTISLAALKRLANHPAVIAIEKQRDVYLDLDKSIPEVKANNIWTRNGSNFSGYTGRGVIVGIIDTGIDFRHANFIKPDGTSRIMRIWDQTMIAPVKPPTAAEVAPAAITTGPFTATLGYGVEYFRDDDINNTLQSENPAKPVRHRDEDGHGTHVAGIAAGNGRQAGGCHDAFRYIGVAPEADLIVVRLWGLTDGDNGKNLTPPQTVPAPSSSLVLDAIRYIMNVANTPTTPVVINCSFGSFTGEIDGSADICQQVNTLLTNNTNGRAIVWSAGNYGDIGFHAAGTVPASGSPPVEMEFTMSAGDTKRRYLSIAYTGSNLEIQLISPVGGAPGTVPWVAPGAVGSSPTANGTIAGGNPGSVIVNNSPNRITINIAPPTSGTPPVNGNNVANTVTAKWKIQLRNTIATPTPFDAFCIYGSTSDSKALRFLNQTSSNRTLNEESSGAECISVGSYAVGGQLAPSSSRGPTLDGRTKPDLAAPGVNITSAAIAKDREGDGLKNCCCECCQDYYVGKGGTSMAAPHITGSVALMLHKNPNLPHSQIKTLLTNNADGRPGDAPPADNVGWGAGKLSTMNSVNVTPVVNPPVQPLVVIPESERQPLLEKFLNTEFGPAYYVLGERYFQEIYGLINSNKRVATAWHRSKGPVWTRIALTAFYNPDFEIPLTAGELHITESASKFLTMLKRYASEELRLDIERGEPYLSLLREGMTLEELVALIGNMPMPASALVGTFS